MKWFGSRLTYANVMSTIAVFAVLGGGAYAAEEIGSKDIAKKAVKSKHIKNKGVKTKDLAKRSVQTRNLGRQAVKGNKVAPGTLLSEHFADGQLLQGEQGPQGPTGPQGPVGPAGATNVVVREASSTPGTLAGQSENVSKSCDAGEVATGGGAFPVNILNTNVLFVRSHPVPAAEGSVPTGWSGTLATDAADGDGFIKTFVVCASP